jgi:hypothetical protein
MTTDFFPHRSIEKNTGPHLFEGVDISGIYDDHDATGVTLGKQSQPAIEDPSPAPGRESIAHPIQQAKTRRSSWIRDTGLIYVALTAAFAMVIGVSLGFA